MGRFIKFAFFLLLGGFLYFVLSYHFIFLNSWKPYKLKKKNLTFEETIVSVPKARSIESILASKVLREAGLGEFFVSIGRMTESELDRIKTKYEE